MSTEHQIHDVAVAEEERRPLITNDFDSSIVIAHQNEDSIFPLPPDVADNLPSLSVPNQRLASLDVFRGLTVAVDASSRMFSILLCLVYLCLLYGLYVPNWEFKHSNLLWSGQNSVIQNVHCEMRGSLDPPCNAVGLIDRLILGEDHMYQRPVYRRTNECSVNSPDYGPLPPDAPRWCLAPFDPEGILSDGCHYLFLGIAIWAYTCTFSGIPLSKALDTLSFMFITAGASGLVLTAIYYIVSSSSCHKLIAIKDIPRRKTDNSLTGFLVRSKKW